MEEEFFDKITDKMSCMDYGGDWIRMDSNFDNILEAMLTLFKLAITEGWIQIMNQAIDTVGFE